MKSFKSVHNVQSIQVKCDLREPTWCSMFKIDRCSMYPGSLPLIFNGSVPGHEKLFNVRRCSMYTGVQFDRFHCSFLSICYRQLSVDILPAFTVVITIMRIENCLWYECNTMINMYFKMQCDVMYFIDWAHGAQNSRYIQKGENGIYMYEINRHSNKKHDNERLN